MGSEGSRSRSQCHGGGSRSSRARAPETPGDDTVSITTSLTCLFDVKALKDI